MTACAEDADGTRVDRYEAAASRGLANSGQGIAADNRRAGPAEQSYDRYRKE